MPSALTSDPDPRWSCYRKKAYQTLDKANEVARAIMEKKNPGVELHGYACVHCGAFHIGRKPH